MALDSLTPRELEVLALLAAGRSSAQIAHELLINPCTVGTHVQHILAKLGVHNRIQAVAVAHSAGLGVPDVQSHGLNSAAEAVPKPGGASANKREP